MAQSRVDYASKKLGIALGAWMMMTGIAAGCGTDVPAFSQLSDAGPSDSGPDEGTPSASFAVGGTVTGLVGSGLVLTNNGGDELAVKNGAFVFPMKVKTGASFEVKVNAQPSAPAQTCTVSGGTGVVGAGNVTSVVVNCSTNGFTVGGTVTGLSGTGLVLQNNAGDDLIVSGSSFAFPTTVADQKPFAVTVKAHPTNLSQTCTVTNGTGTLNGANVTNIAVSCVTNKFTVGGVVTGLDGTGLVLTNNDGDDFPVNQDGTFTFPSSLDDGSDFEVAVKTAPSGPQQTCTVTGGSGKLAGGSVSTVNVNCSVKTFAIGGTITGLEGSGLVLTNNGEELPVSSNGEFAFKAPIADLASYTVTVKTNPSNKWQTCHVTNGTGNVAQAAVTSVAIQCVTNTYKVKAKVEGLEGAGLVLQNNGGDDVPIGNNGTYEFTTSIASGAGYLVSVLHHPTNKSQTCSVSGAGTIAGADADVTVKCVTDKFSVGGQVNGLAPGNFVLLLNDAVVPALVQANGTFKFSTPVESGQTYAVTVGAQPTTPNQTCTVSAGTGTVVAGNIESIVVDCTTNMYTVGGVVSGLTGTGLKLSDGHGHLVTVNGSSFAFPAREDGTTYSVSVDTQPVSPWQTCEVTNGTGALAGTNVGNIAVTCKNNAYLVGGNVTGLAGTVVLTNNGGDAKTITANGPFAFDAPVPSGGLYSVAVKTHPGSGAKCFVKNGSGAIAGAPIANIEIVCVSCPALVNGRCWAVSTGCEDTATTCGKLGLTGSDYYQSVVWDQATLTDIATQLGLAPTGDVGCCVEFGFSPPGSLQTHNYGPQFLNWPGCYSGYPTLKVCDAP